MKKLYHSSFWQKKSRLEHFLEHRETQTAEINVKSWCQEENKKKVICIQFVHSDSDSVSSRALDACDEVKFMSR